MGVGTVVFLASLCLVSTASTIKEKTRPQLQCQPPDMSAMQVVLKTKRNDTGHWISTVGVKQRKDSTTGGVSNQWLVDSTEESVAHHWLVSGEQSTETCEGETPVLDTIFYPSAPPSPCGKLSQRRPTRDVHSTTQYVECICPVSTCPEPAPCTATTASQPAPSGYQRFDGVGFYKYYSQAHTWLEAKRICEQDGGHLLIVNSQSEHNAVMTLLNHFPPSIFSLTSTHKFLYIGAQRSGDNFITVLGDNLATTGFVRWSPGEPNGHHDEFCLTLVRSNGLLNDFRCSAVLNFICEHVNKA